MLLFSYCAVFPLVSFGFPVKDGNGPRNLYVRWPPVRINPKPAGLDPATIPKLPFIIPNPLLNPPKVAPVPESSNAWSTTNFVPFANSLGDWVSYAETTSPQLARPEGANITDILFRNITDIMLRNCTRSSCPSFSSSCPAPFATPSDKNNTTPFSWTWWNSTRQAVASKCGGPGNYSGVISVPNLTIPNLTMPHQPPIYPLVNLPPLPSIHSLPAAPPIVALPTILSSPTPLPVPKLTPVPTPNLPVTPISVIPVPHPSTPMSNPSGFSLDTGKNKRSAGGSGQSSDEAAAACLDAVRQAYLSWYRLAEEQCKALDARNSTAPAPVKSNGLELHSWDMRYIFIPFSIGLYLVL